MILIAWSLFGVKSLCTIDSQLAHYRIRVRKTPKQRTRYKIKLANVILLLRNEMRFSFSSAKYILNSFSLEYQKIISR